MNACGYLTTGSVNNTLSLTLTGVEGFGLGTGSFALPANLTTAGWNLTATITYYDLNLAYVNFCFTYAAGTGDSAVRGVRFQNNNVAMNLASPHAINLAVFWAVGMVNCTFNFRTGTLKIM